MLSYLGSVYKQVGLRFRGSRYETPLFTVTESGRIVEIDRALAKNPSAIEIACSPFAAELLFKAFFSQDHNPLCINTDRLKTVQGGVVKIASYRLYDRELVVRVYPELTARMWELRTTPSPINSPSAIPTTEVKGVRKVKL